MNIIALLVALLLLVNGAVNGFTVPSPRLLMSPIFPGGPESPTPLGCCLPFMAPGIVIGNTPSNQGRQPVQPRFNPRTGK